MAGVVLAAQLLPAGLPPLAGLAHAALHLSEVLHARHSVIARADASASHARGGGRAAGQAHHGPHAHGAAHPHASAHRHASAHAHHPAHPDGGEHGRPASTAAMPGDDGGATASLAHRHGDEGEPHRHVLPVDRLRAATADEPGGEVAPPSPLETRVDDHVPVRRSLGTATSVTAHAPAASPGLPDRSFLPPPTPPPRG